MKITVNPADVRMEKFKGRGPGGQHKNKTETGVRLIHGPTNVRVDVCNERSLDANRETAWKMLAGKLQKIADDREAARKRAARDAKPDAAFSAQIRTYYLAGHPRVVDHRTGHEHQSPKAVLRGDIDGFIRAQASLVS